MGRNPFKPTAGATPPLLVGRQGAIEEFVESVEDGPGAPGRLTIFTGARGVGKTVMLTEVADAAAGMGWVTIAETATPGLIGRLTNAAALHLAELGPAALPGRSVTGVSLPVIGGGLSLSPAPAPVLDWRATASALLDALEPHGTGLLVTVDEVHRHARADLAELATTFQHLVREDRDIALVLAGLPSAVSDLLSDDVLTFLRRATRQVLADVPLEDVRAALAATITTEGRTITDDALSAATRATSGYPFMIQLVGYHVWRNAGEHVIDTGAADAGISAARQRLGSTVHESALADLSAVDRTYLMAMSKDSGPASTAAVAARMGKDAHYANAYRSRLIDAGVIEAAGRGYVDFAIPYLREYLRSHAARIEMSARGRAPRS
jgi:hypothetical protein